MTIFGHTSSLHLDFEPHTLELGAYVQAGAANGRYGSKAVIRARNSEQVSPGPLRAAIKLAPLAAGGRLLKASVQPGRITFVWERTAGRVGLCPPAVRLTGYPILQITDVPRTSYLQDGGAEGDRTPDLCNAIAALSQLSYGPVRFPIKAVARRVWWTRPLGDAFPSDNGNFRPLQAL